MLFDYKKVTEYWGPNPSPVYMVAYVKFLSRRFRILSNTILLISCDFFFFHSVVQTKQHFLSATTSALKPWLYKLLLSLTLCCFIKHQHCSSFHRQWKYADSKSAVVCNQSHVAAS